MSLPRAFTVSAILGSLFLTACAPERFEEPICLSQRGRTKEAPQQAFASGYFPAEYAEPTLTCGFPARSLPLISDIERDWYPRQWLAASEPSLYEAAQCEALPDFVLRFSYIPSFDPSVFIRVQSDKDGLKLIAKELTGAGGYDPGILDRSKEIRLTSKQVADLRTMLDAQGLFDEPADTCKLGFDGSQWIFEIVDQDGYKMIKRWSPSDGAAHDLGKLLIRLSGWRIETY